MIAFRIMTTKSNITVGVLALQGAFREHRQAFERLGAKTVEVRLPKDLKKIDALAMPGGESTTIGKLLVEWELLEPIKKLGLAGLPIMGTCAGAIILSKSIMERGKAMEQPRLNLLDAEVVRNAYGRQVDSFEALIDLTALGLSEPFNGVFIRAPIFGRTGEAVEVTAALEGKKVFVRQANLWALAFHPELSGDDRVHEKFLQTIKK